MNEADVASLLTQVAPLLDAWALDEVEGGWHLSIDEKSGIDIEFDPVVRRLVLTSEIGELPGADRLGKLEILLAYNALWACHGGVRTALDAVDRRLLLLLDLSLHDLDVPSASRVFASFKHVTEQWRRILEAPSTSAGGLAEESAAILHSLNIIRG